MTVIIVAVVYFLALSWTQEQRARQPRLLSLLRSARDEGGTRRFREGNFYGRNTSPAT